MRLRSVCAYGCCKAPTSSMYFAFKRGLLETARFCLSIIHRLVVHTTNQPVWSPKQARVAFGGRRVRPPLDVCMYVCECIRVCVCLCVRSCVCAMTRCIINSMRTRINPDIKMCCTNTGMSAFAVVQSKQDLVVRTRTSRSVGWHSKQDLGAVCVV